MDCKAAEKLIPDFIRGRMETRTAKHFLAHVKKCASCKEELSIQFLVTVGLERLEDGEAFNLNKELSSRIAVAEKHVKIRNMVNTNPDFAKTATVAEEFDNLLMSRFYKSLSYGMLIRANEYELEALERSGEVNAEKEAALKKARDIAIAHHKELTDQLEEEIHYEVVPIRKLVSIQLECGLLVSKYVHEHNIKGC